MYKITSRELLFANQCPRCSSTRIYVDESEFVCLSCSLIAYVEF